MIESKKTHNTKLTIVEKSEWLTKFLPSRYRMYMSGSGEITMIGK